jgi:hypothetical protein
MLGSLEFFNALVVRVRQKPEGYCPVLDNLVSLHVSSIGSRIPRRPVLRKSQSELTSENLQTVPHDNLAVVGLTSGFLVIRPELHPAIRGESKEIFPTGLIGGQAAAARIDYWL